MTTTDPQQRKPRPRQRRSGLKYRSYLNHEIVRMAFMAGQGMTPGQIAETMGGEATGGRVGAQLRKYGVHLPRKGDDDIMQLRWSQRDRRALDAIAEKRQHDAPDIAVIALRILIAEPILFGNLLDEADMIDEAARK
jgi:hypothetical protein